MYGRRKSRIEKNARKWGVFMSAILKQKLIDIANGFTKYGLWKGGGSSALSEMTDVTFSNLQTNDVLTYNGSVWVNDDNLQKQIDTLNSNLNNLIYTKDVQIYFNPNSSRGLWEFGIDSTKFLNAYVVNQGNTEVELSFHSYESGIYISSSITGQEFTVRFVLYK